MANQHFPYYYAALIPATALLSGYLLNHVAIPKQVQSFLNSSLSNPKKIILFLLLIGLFPLHTSMIETTILKIRSAFENKEVMLQTKQELDAIVDHVKHSTKKTDFILINDYIACPYISYHSNRLNSFRMWNTQVKGFRSYFISDFHHRKPSLIILKKNFQENFAYLDFLNKSLHSSYTLTKKTPNYFIYKHI